MGTENVTPLELEDEEPTEIVEEEEEEAAEPLVELEAEAASDFYAAVESIKPALLRSDMARRASLAPRAGLL